MNTMTGIKAVIVGLAAGLAATVAIDVLTMLALPLAGAPATGGFALIGDTAAAFFAGVGIHVAGGVPLGLFCHYVIGIALGGLFGGVASRLAALRAASRLKMAGLGLLYTELISVPIVILPPLILTMTQAAIVEWFGFCVAMHAVFGLVLGLVVAAGRRAPVSVRAAVAGAGR